MQEAPVTAATGVLGPVIAKLATLLGSEYRLRWRTRRDVSFIKSKFKSMYTMLWAIWEKSDLDAESKELKREAWDIVDDVDETIHGFILRMERNRSNTRFIQTKIKESPFKDLKKIIDDMSRRCRSKWKKKMDAQPISSLFSRKSVTSQKPTSQARPFVQTDESEDESKLVGVIRIMHLKDFMFGKEDRTVVEPQLKMGLIAGMAGMGKTTLVRYFYEKFRRRFDVHAFVSVLPSTTMKDVLTSILEQVTDCPTTCTEEEDLINNILDFLKDKRYLIIIDDIWRREEWEIIRESFPGNNLGSRILLTTRLHGMVDQWYEDSGGWVLRVDPRRDSEPHRWLYRHFEGKSADFATNMIAKKHDMVGEGFNSDHPFVHMCGDMPLALVCMLSEVSKEIEQQKQQGKCVKPFDAFCTIAGQVKRNGIQNTPGFEPLVESLQLSYDDLPHHMLKTCLMYCSVYPENHMFERDDLVSRWMAEGFVYKEEAAKGYFEELVNRGFILMQEAYSEEVMYGMHPIIRNFLRCKSREDNFISWSCDIPSSYDHRITRLCVEDGGQKDGMVEQVDELSGMNWSHIKSLVLCGDAMRIPLEKLEHVRVLDLKCDGDLENDHLKDIYGLVHLRYLGLHGCSITEISSEISRLERLEQLVVSHTNVARLPGEIGCLQQLKTLLVCKNDKLEEIPREMGALQLLKTLDIHNTLISELPSEISGLQQLNNLNISGTRIKNLTREMWGLQQLKTLCMGRTEITEVPREIGGLEKLQILDMSHNHVITELPREIGDLQQLKILDLKSIFHMRELPKEMGKLHNLEQLFLSGTGVIRIPREIGELNGLKRLEMDGDIANLPLQISKWAELPVCIQQALKKSDLVSTLAGELLSYQKYFNCPAGLVVGAKHMHIPPWIKQHFNDLAKLDIRISKLDQEQDLKVLSEMPKLLELVLRLEVVPREPIAITSGGFERLESLTVVSRVPRLTFHEGAMPRLGEIALEFQFYGGAPSREPMGIKHLGRVSNVRFKCNKYYSADHPCISATIDVVRKEVQEHPNKIYFNVAGHEPQIFMGNGDVLTMYEDMMSRWQ